MSRYTNYYCKTRLIINYGKLFCRFDIKFSFMHVSEVQIKALIADIVQGINGQHN